MTEGESLRSGQIEVTLVSASLLILQSKRLMLSSAQRRLESTGLEELRGRVAELRVEAEHAQHRYRSAVLAFGSPAKTDYWLVVYGQLIEKGGVLSTRLRKSTSRLPLRERYEASADIEVLEEIMKTWTDSMRRTMSAAVA